MTKCLSTALAVLLATLFGCSSDGHGGNGSGGRTGSGGTSATGGTTSGGVSGTGGSPGGSGSGGSSSGGAIGSGGATTGGVSGTGGMVGSGGAGPGGAATGGAASGGMGTGGENGGKTGGRGGAGGENGAFAPCPVSGNCAVMPLGDSITDGMGSSGGGYRVELFRLAVTNSKRITFVGRASPNGPTTVAGQPFPRNHEGYSGYTIDPGGGRAGISPLVDGAILAGRPEIILLMIGTNDIDLNLDVANAPMRLGALLDKITTDAPNALVVLAQITPLQDDTVNARVQTYNQAMPALVQARVAKGKHIILVNMNAPFVSNANYKTALLADKWHPNNAGYVVMAQTWYAAIQNYLP